MKPRELKKIIEDFQIRQNKLKSLNIGDYIYEPDPLELVGEAYFKHEVVKVDLEEDCVHTLDHSQNGKPSIIGYWVRPAGLPRKKRIKK